MRGGRRLHPQEKLDVIRNRAATQLAQLPDRLRTLEAAALSYGVEIHPALHRLALEADRVEAELPALCR